MAYRVIPDRRTDGRTDRQTDRITWPHTLYVRVRVCARTLVCVCVCACVCVLMETRQKDKRTIVLRYLIHAFLYKTTLAGFCGKLSFNFVSEKATEATICGGTFVFVKITGWLRDMASKVQLGSVNISWNKSRIIYR